MIGGYHLCYALAVVTSRRSLRTDAARNVERIVDAAQRVLARAGSDGAMEDVAAEAGVGVATVYRRFPTKELLLRAVQERRSDEFLATALLGGAPGADPRLAIRVALGAAVRFLADDTTMMAVINSGLLTMDVAHRFFGPVADIVRRGQREGVFRSDLVAEDVPRLVLMLVGTVASFEPGSDGWQRYLDLVLDLLTNTRSLLPPVSRMRDHKPPPVLI